MTKKKKDDEKCQKREERKIKYEAFMQKHKETLEFESVSSMELSDIEENEDVLEVRGGGHLDTFTQPKLFCGYRPHLFTYFDEMLYGSLY